MKKLLLFCLMLLLCISSSVIVVPRGSADELDDINGKLQDLNAVLDQSVKATKPLESELKSMQDQISGIKSRITSIQNDTVQKKKDIDKSYLNLQKQEQLLNHAISDFYVKSYYNSPFLILLSGKSASDITELLTYQKTATDADKAIITNIVLTIQDLETRKQQLADEQKRLITLKSTLDEQSAKLDKLVSSAKSYQATITAQISDLSARQQEIVASKQSSLTSIAGKSIATQTDAGGGSSTPQSSLPQTIRVKMGDGSVKSVSLEDDYLLSLGEMPDAWQSLEAYKAQAVAARTYAVFKMLRASGRDFDVYSDTRDQAYTGSPKGGLWTQAVQATKGQILQDGGGNTVIAYYAANNGGYTLTPNESWNGGGGFPASVRDFGDDGKPNDDLVARCLSDVHYRWEYHYNIGRDGKIQYNDSCPGGDMSNSNSPLTNSEVEDLVDAAIWAGKNGSVPDNSKTHDQIKSEIGGDAIGSIQSISASIASDKYTSTVHVTGSNHTVDLDGQTFRTVYNVRSPGQFLIPSTTIGARFVKYDILRSGDAHGTQGDGWYFYVYGYGHRIGMSQEGALGMAAQSKSYSDILSHYYPGTTLTPVGYSGQVK